MESISALSKEYVRARVNAKEAGVTVNPTALVVEMSFVADGVAPVSGDWKAASWETDTTAEPDVYYARSLVGPGGGVITLVADNDYMVRVRITDATEMPVVRCGVLRVTA